MTSSFRKLGLMAHVVFSVGWIGAVGAFLALAIAALSGGQEVSRAAYLAMNVVGQDVLIPFSVLSLISGVVQSLGTRWGLFKHYWVVVKLVLTIVATVALFLHQFTAVAEAAKLAAGAGSVALRAVSLRQLGVQLRGDAGLALLLLLIATALAVYKPWGLIGRISRSLKLCLAAAVAILVGFVALHLSGRSPHQHSH